MPDISSPTSYKIDIEKLGKKLKSLKGSQYDYTGNHGYENEGTVIGLDESNYHMYSYIIYKSMGKRFPNIRTMIDIILDVPLQVPNTNIKIVKVKE